MEDLIEITKGYFKKNEKQREEIFEEVYPQFVVAVMEQGFSQEEIGRIMGNLIKRMEETEKYEVAELFQQILNKIKEEFFNVQL